MPKQLNVFLEIVNKTVVTIEIVEGDILPYKKTKAKAVKRTLAYLSQHGGKPQVRATGFEVTSNVGRKNSR